MTELEGTPPVEEFHPVWGLVPRQPARAWRTWAKRCLARVLSTGRPAADPHRGVAILAYHGTSDDPSDPWWVDFQGQMDRLDRLGYRVVSLAEAVAIVRHGPLPSRPTVAITFDDGYVNNLDGAFAELHRRGWPASVFVASSFVGRRPYLREDEVKGLADIGIEIGNHTHSHPNMRRLGRQEMRREVETCQRRLEEIVGYAPRHFVFPDGAYSPAACAVLESVGLEAACTGRVGFNLPGVDRYRLRRLTIERGEGPEELETRLRGGYDILDLRQRYLDHDPPRAIEWGTEGRSRHGAGD